MDFQGRGVEGGEPSREGLVQLRLERKRRAVLNHDVPEARHGPLPLRRQGLEPQPVDEPRQHPAHERGEADAGETVVERLVRNLNLVLMVERAEQVRQRFPLPAGQRRDNRQEQPMRRDGAQPDGLARVAGRVDWPRRPRAPPRGRPEPW